MQEEVADYRRRENEFETQLMLHRPDLYEVYKEEKDELEAMDLDHIVYVTPESVEEYEEAERMFRQAQGVPSFVYNEQPKPFISTFNGINLDELEDE